MNREDLSKLAALAIHADPAVRAQAFEIARTARPPRARWADDWWALSGRVLMYPDGTVLKLNSYSWGRGIVFATVLDPLGTRGGWTCTGRSLSAIARELRPYHAREHWLPPSEPPAGLRQKGA